MTDPIAGDRPFIAVEWGTSRLVARLIDGRRLVERHERPLRLQQLDRPAMAAELASLKERWPQAKGPILLAGMIGSDIGWRQVPQVPLPAAGPAILAGTKDAGEGVVGRILPGLLCRNIFGDHDVARGEEVAALGALMRDDLPDPLLLVTVPGMHAKWLLLADGAVQSFHSAMTVELATLVARDSVLSSVLDAAPGDGDVFRDGAKRGAGGGIARLLFSTRGRILAGELAPQRASSFVWGVLIGADIADALPSYRRAWPGLSVAVAGAHEVAALYVAALDHLAEPAKLLDADVLATQGFISAAAIMELRDAA